MSSSISSFRTELKVIAVVLVVMIGLEIREWRINAQRGNEIRSLREFPKLADDLAASKGTHVLLLGNSLTQVGYDMPLLKTLLDGSGHEDLHVANISQTGSAPAEWYHNFERVFVRRRKTPDVIVINMSPAGMADGLPAGYRVGWLANETDWRDVPEVLLKDLANVEVGGQYLTARISPLYADRWDVRIEIVRQFVPDIWAGMAWLNTAQLTVAKAKRSPVKKPTYSLLNRMLAMARANHAKVILVAMPAREPYELDPVVPEIVKVDSNVEFVDCRSIPDLKPADFDDGWHLGHSGAKIFTTYMATQLPLAVGRFNHKQ